MTSSKRRQSFYGKISLERYAGTFGKKGIEESSKTKNPLIIIRFYAIAT